MWIYVDQNRISKPTKIGAPSAPDWAFNFDPRIDHSEIRSLAALARKLTMRGSK